MDSPELRAPTAEEKAMQERRNEEENPLAFKGAKFLAERIRKAAEEKAAWKIALSNFEAAEQNEAAKEREVSAKKEGKERAAAERKIVENETARAKFGTKHNAFVNDTAEAAEEAAEEKAAWVKKLEEEKKNALAFAKREIAKVAAEVGVKYGGEPGEWETLSDEEQLAVGAKLDDMIARKTGRN